ncbi:glycosyltransferase [Paenibacillus terrigena]|uniref:glycosyltransferase n=1 Tax=Paenibacillus terrigena TaxID=369333 RepID=UPI00036F134D|nr:glycosyltransferase [Paenibacillus terrigena]
MLDEHKVCFITCVNDFSLYEESTCYIQGLNVPEGMTVEILSVTDAKSMTSGYNEAIRKTDAKYKVYLHQDVFIINKNFISDILEVFSKNINLGLLGVVGSKTMPSNGIWWDSSQKVGSVFDSHTGSIEKLEFETPINEYEKVIALDGLILITQYDVAWREDLFDGWHCYDVSQCIEFIRVGYENGVIRQEKPWCIHDCGYVSVKNYENDRKKYLEEYTDIEESYIENIHSIDAVLARLYTNHQYDSIVKITSNILDTSGATPGIFIYRANSMNNMGRFDEAVLCLEQSLIIYPNHYELTLALANVLEMNHNSKRAIYYLRKLIAVGYTQLANRVKMLQKEAGYPKLLLWSKHTTSGCNVRALFSRLPDRIREQCQVDFYAEEVVPQNYMEYDVIFTAHGNPLANNLQYAIELWHGFPIKGLGNMEKRPHFSPFLISNNWKKVDTVISYSTMFNTIFNGCLGLYEHQYYIAGAPRNDYLFESSGKKHLERILDSDLSSYKIIMYAPTFRKASVDNIRNDGERLTDNIFGFNHFNENQFSDFLIEHNIILLIKLHPVEEEMLKEKISERNMKNTILMTDQILNNNGIDFYEFMNCVDVLITDYSSLYFDYLLLNRPIIFVPTDIEEYTDRRGFLMEPYEEWTPGDKVFSQDDLEYSILDGLRDNKRYERERNQICNYINKYNDGESSKRVWDFVERILCIE